MKTIRIAIALASLVMLSACKDNEGTSEKVAIEKPFNYHVVCYRNNDTVLFEDDVYTAHSTQAGSATVYKKYEKDKSTEITNALCVIAPI